ncbi:MULTISPECIES: hypothetical protein [Microbacterium]|uniref:DUF3618 domain-containing protein n=1 Tax=Microbacterium marmarense TaxID=3122051 RepID=A0ABU8LQB9_9MICO
MSSDAPQILPRTAVPNGLVDPVEKARAELKAALAAIEIKGNVPRRLADRLDEATLKIKKAQQRNPERAMAVAVAGAVTVGVAVWALVNSITR